MPALLLGSFNQTKKFLKRRRAMETVHRIKELDSNCVQWLVRQTGQTLAEKAGHKPSDTCHSTARKPRHFRNRVARDLLRRCESLANDYLRVYATRFYNVPTIHRILGFEAYVEDCIRFLICAEIAVLPRLPNLITFC